MSKQALATTDVTEPGARSEFCGVRAGNAVIRGSRESADCTSAPSAAAGGGRQLRAFIIFDSVENAGLMGRGYSTGARPGRRTVWDDFRFVNCTFQNDGGHLCIHGGDLALTNFVFENCPFHRPFKPGKMAGHNVGPMLFNTSA